MRSLFFHSLTVYELHELAGQPNTIQHKLGDLYNYHCKRLSDSLSRIPDIAIAVDFWSDEKLKFYLFLTDHFITEDYIQLNCLTIFKF